MAILLTQQAADHVQALLAKNERAVGLRLGVKSSGCSGLSYTVDLADALDERDEVFEQRGVKLVIERKNLPLLEGLELDYVREGLNRRFDFRNPNVKGTCGCGESFAV